METLALSPHLDDAVLSCWHRIDQAPGSKVVTLYSGTPAQTQPSDWDIATGFASPQEAMAARREENRRALSDTPSVPVDLGYLEHAYRQRPAEIDRIVQSVLRVSGSDATFIAAAGISNWFRHVHPDHIATRRVGQRLIELGHEVLFYAEIPYIFPRFSHDNWPAHLWQERIKRKLGMDVAIEPHELTLEQRQSKRRALAAYASQLPLLEQGYRGALTKPSALRWEVIFRPI